MVRPLGNIDFRFYNNKINKIEIKKTEKKEKKKKRKKKKTQKHCTYSSTRVPGIVLLQYMYM